MKKGKLEITPSNLKRTYNFQLRYRNEKMEGESEDDFAERIVDYLRGEGGIHLKKGCGEYKSKKAMGEDENDDDMEMEKAYEKNKYPGESMEAYKKRTKSKKKVIVQREREMY